MNAGVYTRYELLRTIRNKRITILSLAFPIVLYLAIAASEPQCGRLRRLGGISSALLHGRARRIRDDERHARRRRAHRR